MHLFATTYFPSIQNRDHHFETLKELSFFPELYFALGWDYFSYHDHKEFAKIIWGELGDCSVHLPYRDLEPGRGDPKVEEKLRRAAAVAAIYNPSHLIGHSCYSHMYDSILGTMKHLIMGRADLTSPICIPSDRWLTNSTKVWQAVLRETECYLYIENTTERSPLPIQDLLKRMGSHRSSMCFDVGHWHYSGMGADWDNMDEWIEIASDNLKHYHLHDNDGSSDQHLPLGRSDIDFQRLIELTIINKLSPSATIENHTSHELIASAGFLVGAIRLAFHKLSKPPEQPKKDEAAEQAAAAPGSPEAAKGPESEGTPETPANPADPEKAAEGATAANPEDAKGPESAGTEGTTETPENPADPEADKGPESGETQETRETPEEPEEPEDPYRHEIPEIPETL